MNGNRFIKKNEFVSAILSFKHNGICIPWLQVKKSDIIGANLGLFILQDLPQNFLIGVYIGNKVKKGNADVESNFAIENSKGFKMDCPKFPDLMMGMGIHMGNDLDFVVQDRICQYKLYVIKNDKLSSLLEVKKNQRFNGKRIKEIDLINVWIKNYKKKLEVNRRTINTEKNLDFKSTKLNNANLHNNFGCALTKDVSSGHEITYEYNWVVNV